MTAFRQQKGDVVSIFKEYGSRNPLIMSAAGLAKTFELEQIERLAAAADKVLVGSITPQKRDPNEGTCENFDIPLYSLNAWGMPNPGWENLPRYTHMNEEVAKRFAAVRDKVIVSLAAFSPLEYSAIFYRLRHWSGQVELNFGCPNVRDDGTQHKIVSFDPATMSTILYLIEAAKREEGPNHATGVKLSPYSDPGLLKEIAAVIAESGTVDYVAVTNTFPNGLGFIEGKPAIMTRQAGYYGGIGGEAMKPISLSNAAQFREALPPDIDVIRVGGVSSGDDIEQSYDVGCTGVQVATAIAREGIGVLTKIRQEYADIVG